MCHGGAYFNPKPNYIHQTPEGTHPSTEAKRQARTAGSAQNGKARTRVRTGNWRQRDADDFRRRTCWIDFRRKGLSPKLGFSPIGRAWLARPTCFPFSHSGDLATPGCSCSREADVLVPYFWALCRALPGILPHDDIDDDRSSDRAGDSLVTSRCQANSDHRAGGELCNFRLREPD
jgi:hypothetical protein